MIADTALEVHDQPHVKSIINCILIFQGCITRAAIVPFVMLLNGSKIVSGTRSHGRRFCPISALPL